MMLNLFLDLRNSNFDDEQKAKFEGIYLVVKTIILMSSNILLLIDFFFKMGH
jgi:hypothetical protein